MTLRTLAEPPMVAPWHRPIWWITLAGAMSTEVLGWAFLNPIASPGLYVLVWTFAFCAYPRTVLQAASMSWLPWLMPVLGFLSFLWSREPGISAKMGVEMFFTLLTGLVMCRQLPPRSVIAILQICTLIGGILSILFGRVTDGLIGIYGSKNLMSFYSGMLLLSSTAVFFDGKQERIFRLLAIPGLLLAPVLLLKGRSVGAMVSCTAAVGMVLVFSTVRLVPRKFRASYVVLFGLVAVAVAVVAGFTIAEEKAALLRMVGKSENLTGRTYLWARATELIGERPVLGYGYYAFWVQEYVEAEGLWRYSNVASRMGFHFHNLYYQTTIDLGLVGLVCMVTMLVVTLVAVVARALRSPGGDTAFMVGYLTYLYARTMSEVDFNWVFLMQTMLFPAFWVWSTQYEKLQVIWRSGGGASWLYLGPTLRRRPSSRLGAARPAG